MDFTKWHEIVFYGPFVMGIIFLVLTGLGMLPSDGGADVDADADADSGFDQDLGASHHVGEINEAGPSLIDRALSVLGVGKVPLSLLLVSFCFMWGFFGWASNRVLEGLGFSLDWFGWISVPVAFMLTMPSVSWTARLIARFMPTTETNVQRERDFVGKRATARYTITDSAGSAVIKDANNDSQEVLCRVEPAQEKIASGTTVVLLRYDEGRNLFFVRPDRLSQVS